MPPRKPDKMPARNKKNFRSTKSGAGMTKAGVAATVARTPAASKDCCYRKGKAGKCCS